MSEAPAPDPGAAALAERLEQLGRSLGEREREHAAGLKEARAAAEKLRERVAAAVERFHAGAESVGAGHLRLELSAVRTDDKHLRSVEFELQRGRHRAIVTVKSRGEVTLVGPFRSGKTEGPCRSFPLDAETEIDAALADFLASFAEEAATP